MGALSTKNKINTIDTNAEDCAICLGEVKKSDKNTIILECNHSYHKKCIDLWLVNKQVCPLCLQTVTNYNPEKVELEINDKKPYKIEKRVLLNILSLLFVFLMSVCIINIILVNITSSFINDNYIETNNISECINIIEIPNYNNSPNIKLIPDNIVHAFCIISLFLTICISKSNITWLFFFVTYFFDALSICILIYRYVIFRKYLDNMSKILFCENDMYNRILIHKVFFLVNIPLTLVLSIIYNFFVTIEYFSEQQKYLKRIEIV
jgi:hypothetical protein